MHPMIERNTRASLIHSWLRHEIEYGDQRRADYFTPVWTGSPATLIEVLGDDTDQEEAEELFKILEDSGEWDRLTGVNFDVNQDQWFYVPALEDSPVSMSKAELEAGNAAMDVTELPRNQDWLRLTDEAGKADVVDLAMQYKLQHVMRAVESTDVRVSLPAVQWVNIVLASRYLINARFTLMSFEQVSEATGLSIRVVASAIKVLTEGGIWGVTRGCNGYKSRFYPLFVDAAADLFATLLQVGEKR